MLNSITHPHITMSDEESLWEQLIYEEKSLLIEIETCINNRKPSQLQILLSKYQKIIHLKEKMCPVQNNEVDESDDISISTNVQNQEWRQDTDDYCDEIVDIYPSSFTCPICLDEVDIQNCYQLIECGHQYCHDCLEEYLRIKIVNGRATEIKCPSPMCGIIVQSNDVHSVVDKQTSNKYEEFTLQQYLRTEPNARWCPRPNCGIAVIGDPSNPRIKCAECLYEYCFLCRDEWHIGTCEDLQKWKLENGKADKEFNKWASEFTKPCPRCRIRTEKFYGCNHMTCASCRYEWCWICSSEYTANHYSVYNMFGCPGMQFAGDEDEHNLMFRTQAKRMAAKILLGLVAFPVAVMGAPVVAVRRVQEMYRRHLWRKQQNRLERENANSTRVPNRDYLE
eukprot:TRINITY_DN10877_c0_g1_i1.p1 TRINITY_DN10877_c0_g1~~TRINITY_DN10877_c0_g1_i1.p1  ORF type:complete len:394 (-),score=34.44 TRINITY_DN10877_c0_g1_i1:139-1320(-)